MPNVNRVDLGAETLIDISSDTITPADVLNGATFHDASGTLRTGTAEIYFDDTTIVLSMATFNDTTTVIE